MRRARRAALLAPALLAACAVPGRRGGPAPTGLDAWLGSERGVCVSRLLRAASPEGTVHKEFPADAVAPERAAGAHADIVPAAGAVVAAPPAARPAPDYFFHWVRDSALVMSALVDSAAGGPDAPDVVRRWSQFVRFSRRLQQNPAPEGEGEPRFNADGSPDFLKWSRPQFDGPALRALALMHAESRRVPFDGDAREALNGVVREDLDFLAAHLTEGFDLWEEYKGRDFYALAVQAAALDEGARRARAAGDARRAAAYGAAKSFRQDYLRLHWDGEKSRFGFAAGPRTYWDGTSRPKPGGNLDAGVLLAAVHGARAEGPASVLDDRVLATVVQLEDLFARLFAVNARRAADEGVLLGRYEGDEYGGGNPWVLVTLAAAELDYSVAARLGRTPHYPATALNQEFFTRALKRAGSTRVLKPGEDLCADAAGRRELQKALLERGDDVLRAVRRWTPDSGELSEQLDKNTGAPAGGHDLSWSYAAFLTATAARFDAAQSAAR